MRLIGLVLALGLVLAPPFAEGQKPGKVPRIGMLMPVSPEDAAGNIEAFQQRLRELGYLEGKSIVIERRYSEGRNERVSDLASELVRLPVDLIVTWGTPTAKAAKNATSTIPIVMASSGDPVGTGLVASLAKPGGNVTGISNIDVGLAAKRLDLLKELVPKLSLVAVLRNPTNPSGGLQLTETRDAARSLGIKIQLIDVRDPRELESAFAVMVKARADAFTVMADPLFLSQQNQIGNFAMTSRLPSIFARKENVDAGGLISYGPTLADQFRQAATLVDRILKGSKPEDLPVEEPTRIYLMINLKTAKALGLTIPQSILLRADQVIE
jgi:putative ABC transport system substrate-binding protein